MQVTPTSGLEPRGRQVVQPAARLRLPDPRRGHAGHLRPHGDAAPLRHRRAEAGREGVRALRRRLQGPDGGRGAPRRHRAAPFALTACVQRPCSRFLGLSSRSRAAAAAAGADARAADDRLAGRPAARLPGRGGAQRRRPRAGPDVPALDAGRPRHAVRLRPGRAGRDVDAEHLHPARHAVHPARRHDRADRREREPLSTRTIPSGEPVLAVLELNAGTAARLGIKAGDRVEHPLFKR